MRKIGFLGAVALVLALAGTAYALSDGGKTTGGAESTTAAGFVAKMNVNAQGTPTSAEGRVKRVVTDPATGMLVRELTVDVTCYFQDASDPSVSRFGGPVMDETALARSGCRSRSSR